MDWHWHMCAFHLTCLWSFGQIDYRGTNQFWKSIGQAIQPSIGGGARLASDRNPTLKPHGTPHRMLYFSSVDCCCYTPKLLTYTTTEESQYHWVRQLYKSEGTRFATGWGKCLLKAYLVLLSSLLLLLSSTVSLIRSHIDRVQYSEVVKNLKDHRVCYYERLRTWKLSSIVPALFVFSGFRYRFRDLPVANSA